MSKFQFSVVPWNVRTGADSTRKSINLLQVLENKTVCYDDTYANKLIADLTFDQLEVYTVNLIMGLV